MEFHLTGAYFWGRASITSILINHTRAYFQVKSYFRGNRVVLDYSIPLLKIMEGVYLNPTSFYGNPYREIEDLGQVSVPLRGR